MQTSIEMLCTALETAASTCDRTPYDIAAAAAGIGHLGRALVAAATVEQSTRRGYALDTLVRQLGQECVDLAATAPPAETRTTLLAAAVGDAIGTALGGSNAVERRVLIARTVDALDPLLAVVGELPENTGPRHRLEGIEVLTAQVQQVANLTRIDRDVAQAVLHRELASKTEPAADTETPVAGIAMGVLLGLTTSNPTLTVAEVLQASIACEVLARSCEPLGARPSELLPKHMSAADGWLAVQATLAAVRDHPLRANEPASGIATAALMVSRAALVAAPSDVAAAAQHLPDIADDLFGAARRWTENTLDRRTSPLPGERRQPATLERAIARVSGALDAASTLSVVLADDLGHSSGLEAARWTRHHEQAHGEAFRDAVGEAQAVAFTYVRPNFLALTNSIDRLPAVRASQHRSTPMDQKRAVDPALPTGYKIAESGVPGVPPKYQVLRGSGRDQQFIGMRSSKDEAAQLAQLHYRRAEAERAARVSNPRPPAPGRGMGR